MSTEYTKKKNAELEDLLKSRSLPHTGKKAELIARLQQSDADQAASSTKPSTTTAAATTAGEDEIDWEDDAAVATDPASAATIAAGGLTQPANPNTVPNQIPSTDPSKTSDLTVDPPTTTTDPSSSTTKPTTTTTETETETETPAPSKPSLSANLPSTTLDSELSKRKARAARFGIKESDTDALKAIERAKKFGTGDAGDRVAVKGLDEALPEHGVKRGRGRDDGEGRGEEKRSRVRGGGGRRGRSGTPKGGKGGSGLSEKDRLAAEARKAKFAQKA